MKTLTQDLPAGLAEGLHILPPWTTMLLAAVLITLLVAIIIWALAYYLYRKSKQTIKPPPASAIPYQQDSIRNAIESIRRKYNESKQYREGCHVLSAVMKTHVEKRTGVEVEEMTPGEITRTLEGDSEWYFQDLGKLQFNVMEPDKGSFEDICQHAKQVAKSKHRIRQS